MSDSSVSLAAVGDIMLGDRPLMVGFGVRSRIESQNGYDPFGCVQWFLRQHDLVFGNLESVLSDHGVEAKNYRSVQMRGPDSAVVHLKNAGFNLLSVANNHIMQHGDGAFDGTMRLVRENGMEPVGCLDGSGTALPVFREAKGMKLGFLAFSLRPEKYAQKPKYARCSFDEIVQKVTACKKQCDFLVLSLHWGDEYVFRPSEEQIRQGHLLADAGASLILGHHPHVIQGVERYKRSVIAYSLGNFVFDVHQKRLRQTCIFVARFAKNIGIDFVRIPVYLDGTFRPRILGGHEAAGLQRKFLETDGMIAETAMPSLLRHRYRWAVRLNELRVKMENRLLFLRSIRKYEPWILRQSLYYFVEGRLK